MSATVREARSMVKSKSIVILPDSLPGESPCPVLPRLNITGRGEAISIA
jgi:hypothetical protein